MCHLSNLNESKDGGFDKLKFFPYESTIRLAVSSTLQIFKLSNVSGADLLLLGSAQPHN